MTKIDTPAPKVERGVIAGNVYDKYGSRSPLVSWIMRGFLKHFAELVQRTGATHAHEVGCGEGRLTLLLASLVEEVRASDFSARIVGEARQLAITAGTSVDFSVEDIYKLDPKDHSAELIVCCEVLEHLTHPAQALKKLAALAQPWLLVSVPWEPIWRILNLIRGNYLSEYGNTPGHLNHWSRTSFLRLLSHSVEVVEVRAPLPWTMALCRRKTEQ